MQTFPPNSGGGGVGGQQGYQTLGAPTGK